MKVKNNNVLWLLNTTKHAVSISDLGVKVAPGNTVNIYKHNPYLTKEQVDCSLKSGSLASHLASKTVKIVNKNVSSVADTIGKIKASKEGNSKAIKTKSSVVLDSSSQNEEDGESFDFADYGVSDIGALSKRQNDGSVVMKTEPLAEKPQSTETKLEPQVESGVSKQSQIVMKVTQEAMVDPTGPIAPASQPTTSQPFTVVKPEEKEGVWCAVADDGKILTSKDGSVLVEGAQESEEPTSFSQEQQTYKSYVRDTHKDESGAIVVGNAPARSIKKISQQPESEADGALGDADDSVIVFGDVGEQVREPEKLDDGAIVMKVEPEPEPVKRVRKKKVKE